MDEHIKEFRQKLIEHLMSSSSDLWQFFYGLRGQLAEDFYDSLDKHLAEQLSSYDWRT